MFFFYSAQNKPQNIPVGTTGNKLVIYYEANLAPYIGHIGCLSSIVIPQGPQTLQAKFGFFEVTHVCNTNSSDQRFLEMAVPNNGLGPL